MTNRKRPVYLVVKPYGPIEDDAFNLITIKQTSLSAQQEAAKYEGAVVKKGFVTPE